MHAETVEQTCYETRKISSEDRAAFIGSESMGSFFKAAIATRGGTDSKNRDTGAIFLGPRWDAQNTGPPQQRSTGSITPEDG